jgi:hypothetical protein
MSTNINHARSEATDYNVRTRVSGKLFLGSSMSPKAQELRARYEKLSLEIHKAKSGTQGRPVQP